MATCEVAEEIRSGSPARAEAGRSTGLGVGNLVAGGIAFLLLTIGIFWYQFHRIQAGDDAPRWGQLHWGYLVLIFLCLPVETLVSGLRIWVLSRVLHPDVSLWTCIKAEWANVAMNLLTPAHSGGGPGQVYMLNRDGVRAGTALTISLLGFLGTMAGLLGMGLYSLLISGIGHTGPLFPASIGALGVISAAMVLAGMWPALFRVGLGRLSRAFWRMRGGRRRLHDWWPPGDARIGSAVDRMGPLAGKLADIMYTYRDDVGRFLRVGKASFVWVCLLSIAFLLSRCLLPYLCVRFLGIKTSTFGHILEVQMALIFLIFFAPTPGGAGVAEGLSLSIMAEIVPIGFAPYYNLLWRFSTAYLAAIAGLVCLLRALAEDARLVVRHPR